MADFFFTIGNVVQNYLIMSSAVALVIWYIQFLWKRRFMYIHSWKVEGPLSFPIIGCGYLFLGDGIDIMQTITKLQQNMKTDLFRVWLGPKLVYCMCKPEHIETVLNHPKALNKASAYKFVADGLGYGLLTAPVKKWRYHRKLLAPAFHRTILDSFVEVVAEKSIIFMGELERAAGEKRIDLEQLTLRYTMDVMCQTAMGVNMNIQRDKLMNRPVFLQSLEALNCRFFRIWLHPDFFWKLSSLKLEYDRGVRKFRDVTDSIMAKKTAERNEELKLKQHCLDAEIGDPNCERLPLLDLMMKTTNFTEEEVKEEIDIFLVAGSDTTATSICCLLIMLGMHTEIQKKIYEEVIDIMGPDRIVEASDLTQMKYTERVIKENLRLFPIVPIFGREIEEDIDLGDAILPAGSSVVFLGIPIHRNPKYWTDPLKFDPDRFLPEEMAKRHPCTYFPFSYGPRNCIGWKFAISIMKVAVATLIRQYKILTEYKSVEEVQLKVSSVLELAEGSKVWLEKR